MKPRKKSHSLNTINETCLEERLRRTMFFFRILQKEIWIYLAFLTLFFKALLILFCQTDIKNI